MKTKGRRQSDNVDDIRGQKPKVDVGYEMITKNTAGETVGGGLKKTKSVVSKKPANMTELPIDDNFVRMAKKVGMDKMEDAAAANSAKNEAANRKAMEDSLGDIQKQTNTWAYSKPKVLKEAWTPRPLKK